MKLLILTQKVDINDDILGFFHDWILEFAKKCEQVTVICLEKREHNLPENVKVLSLGKEANNFQFSIFKKIKYAFNFYKYIWRERNNYDSVFVHMNPIYIVLAGIFWRLWNKKIGLWYVHKSIDLKLMTAEKLADKIFTASKESFRMASKKVIITGHGIDAEKFKISAFAKASADKQHSIFTILTAGRISKVKNIRILIEAAEILENKNFSFEVRIAGAPITEQDKDYLEKMKGAVKIKNLEDKIFFAGPVPNKKIAEFYKTGDLFVNLSDTGSVDKAVLEAMASGLPVLTSNEAFKNILPEKYFTEKNAGKIAEKIILLSRSGKDPALRNYVVLNHGMESTVAGIAEEMKK